MIITILLYLQEFIAHTSCISDILTHFIGSCSCNDPSGSCIMASVINFPSATHWSDCSRSDLNTGITFRNLDRCLMNEPSITVGDPVCGNGIREGDEMCDCGLAVVGNYQGVLL